MLKCAGKEMAIILNKVGGESRDIMLNNLKDEIFCIIPQKRELFSRRNKLALRN